MDLLDAHGRGMDVFDRAMNKVGPNDWDSPTPCTEWTVRDLVNHLVAEQLWVPDLLAGKTIAEVGDRFDGDQLGADPLRAWRESARAARAAWLAPGVLARKVHLSFGDADATEYGWQMVTDLVVHGWDLATALGADAGIDDDVATTVLAYVAPQAAAWSGMSIFADPVPVPTDADPRTRLIALTGRRP